MFLISFQVGALMRPQVDVTKVMHHPRFEGQPLLTFDFFVCVRNLNAKKMICPYHFQTSFLCLLLNIIMKNGQPSKFLLSFIFFMLPCV